MIILTLASQTVTLSSVIQIKVGKQPRMVRVAQYLLIISPLLWPLTGCVSMPRHLNTPDNHIDKTIILSTARAQLGVDYKYGGSSPEQGFDCSGLVRYSYQQAGVTLPRTAYGQLKRTRSIKRKQLKPGDLLFFRIYRSRVSHVGIYLGKQRFIHAPSTGKSVSIGRLDTPYWQKRFVRAGRIFRNILN